MFKFVNKILLLLFHKKCKHDGTHTNHLPYEQHTSRFYAYVYTYVLHNIHIKQQRKDAWSTQIHFLRTDYICFSPHFHAFIRTYLHSFESLAFLVLTFYGKKCACIVSIYALLLHSKMLVRGHSA